MTHEDALEILKVLHQLEGELWAVLVGVSIIVGVATVLLFKVMPDLLRAIRNRS